MNEARLKAFEDMLSAIQKKYNETSKSMSELKAAGKEKTVTYKQLFATKLQLQAMLTYYQTYGLLDNKS